MRLFAVALAATLILLLSCSSVAFAGWSAPQSFGVSSYAVTALAVDARGDAALAWATRGNPEFAPTYRTSVHVTVRTARGRLSTRTVWSSHDAEAESLSVVLGAGEVTVAWDTRSRAEAQGRTIVIRAAYGPLIGRWPAPRAIRRVGYEPPSLAIPSEQHLAIAPDGEVLLAFNTLSLAGDSGPRGVAVSWRTPGEPFGVSQVLRRALYEAIPQFDARGTAYLSAACNGSVTIAPAHSRRFGRPVVVTNTPVFSFTLAVAGAGRGLAAWVAGECSPEDWMVGNAPGPVFASVLSGGKFGEPLELTPAATQAIDASAVAAPGDGTVGWDAGEVGGPPVAWPQPFSVQIGSDGVPGATQTFPVTGPWVRLLASDGGGDEVFGPITPSPEPLSPLFVRPASGGADEPAPSREGQFAVATPVGRAVALAWNTSPTGAGPIMELSVWRP